MFSGAEHQDAHEFLRILIDWMHLDLETLNVVCMKNDMLQYQVISLMYWFVMILPVFSSLQSSQVLARPPLVYISLWTWNYFTSKSKECFGLYLIFHTHSQFQCEPNVLLLLNIAFFSGNTPSKPYSCRQSMACVFEEQRKCNFSNILWPT